MPSPWIILLALKMALSAHAGMYGQPVVNLDAKTFKTVMATEHAAMVAFVAPWCGHCKALAPEYTSAAQSLSPLIPFYAVDCDEASNKRLCAEYQIQGFPTIKAFPRAGKGAARDYQGERKKGALVDYAKGLVPDRVKKLRVDDGVEKGIGKWLAEKSAVPHVLLIHPSTPSIPFLWKVLGHRLHSKMNLGFMRDTPSHQVLSTLGVYDPKDTTKDATRAVLWRAGETSLTDVVEYDGVMKFNALLEWLQGHLSPDTAQRNRKQEPIDVPDKKRKGTGSKVEDAPEPVPEDIAADEPELSTEPRDVPPPRPEPEMDARDGPDEGEEPVQTVAPHEEL